MARDVDCFALLQLLLIRDEQFLLKLKIYLKMVALIIFTTPNRLITI